MQSAFWKRFGKEPSLGFPMDLTNLHALLNAQKALWQRIDFASTRIQAAKYPSLLPYRRIGAGGMRLANAVRALLGHTRGSSRTASEMQFERELCRAWTANGVQWVLTGNGA